MQETNVWKESCSYQITRFKEILREEFYIESDLMLTSITKDEKTTYYLSLLTDKISILSCEKHIGEFTSLDDIKNAIKAINKVLTTLISRSTWQKGTE